MKTYKIETKEKKWFPLDGWATKLEMKAFGWHYQGEKIEYYDKYKGTIDYEAKEIRIEQESDLKYTFLRVKPYTGNILFNLLEVFMNVHSWIRRKLIYLLWFLTAAALVFGAIETVQNGALSEALYYALLIIAIVYAPTIFYSLLAVIYRFVFRIDARLKKSLRKNGYRAKQY